MIEKTKKGNQQKIWKKSVQFRFIMKPNHSTLKWIFDSLKHLHKPKKKQKKKKNNIMSVAVKFKEAPSEKHNSHSLKKEIAQPQTIR